jgi:hypothetical protein
MINAKKISEKTDTFIIKNFSVKKYFLEIRHSFLCTLFIGEYKGKEKGFIRLF